FISTSLPSHGDLSEPDGGPAINRVPYPLPVTKNVVSYTPCPYFGGADSFKFKANDSGTPPTGGESNIATVTVNVDDKLYTDYATGSNTYIQLMMNTGNFYDARSQVIYLQNDIGPARYLTDLALNIYIAPGRTLQNWTIRMQHTNLTYFNDVVNQFLTSGWTTVYQGSVGTSQTGWVNFHFQTPFEYNGTQNLLVDFSFNNSGRTSPGGGHFIDNAGSNRVLTLASQTGEHEDPLDWGFWALGGSYYLGDYVPSAKFIGTVPIDPIAGEFDASCDVDLSDIGIFSSAWKTVSGGPNYNPDCNISDPKGTGIIENDLLILLNNWMKTYP
ncbi:MAG: hypothetical protein KAR47_02250, partial [Planctomycetes bacterium]|nr:hypothetical protein [Planctomycetota bacterium]